MQIARIAEIETEAASLRLNWKSFADLERLDLLDRLLSRYGEQEPRLTGYSKSRAPENADFPTLAASIPPAALISALTKHMEELRMIYPKDYDEIMRKLRSA